MANQNDTQNSSGGVGRVKAKLELSIKNGNFYEAHQMYRTLYARYNLKKRYEQARDLVLTGARLFFQKEQSGSAFDLSLLFVDSLVTTQRSVDDILIEILGELHSHMDVNHPDLEKYENKALQWTATCADSPKTGHVHLRKLFAQNLWRNQCYMESRQHFLYSHDGTGCGKMLVELSVQFGKSGEEDMFIVQTVLQYLCIRSVQTAHDAFAKYTKLHPNIQETNVPFSLPLLNFLFFLLTAIDKRKLAWFTILCEIYKPSLERDPSYFQYLEKIGEKYFELKFPEKKKRGLLENLFEDLFENGEKELMSDQNMQADDLD